MQCWLRNMPIKVNQQGKKNSQHIFFSQTKMQTNADINMSNQPTPQSTTALVELHNDHEATGHAPIQGFDGDEHPLLMQSVATYRIENSVHDFDMSSLDYKKPTQQAEEWQIEVVPHVNNDSASTAEAIKKAPQSLTSRFSSTLYIMILITIAIDIVWLTGVALFIMFAVLAILQGGYLSTGYAIGLGISGTIVLVSFIAAVAVPLVTYFQFRKVNYEMHRNNFSPMPEAQALLKFACQWYVLIMVNLPMNTSIIFCCILAFFLL